MKYANIVVFIYFYFCCLGNSVAAPVISSLSFHLTMENLVSFKGSLDTLSEIKKAIDKRQKGAYVRFGMQDYHLCHASSELSGEIREILCLNGRYVIKALPLCPEEVGIFEGGILPIINKDAFKGSINILKKMSRLWGGEIRTIYSPLALHYSVVHYVKHALCFFRLLKKNSCLFVGYNDVSEDMIKTLFGEHCNIIKIPRSCSYRDLSSVELDCLRFLINDDQYKIVITSIDSFGKILQNRLWKKLDNVFLFDCDSLIDSLCGCAENELIHEGEFSPKEFLKLMEGSVKVLCTAAVLHKNYEGRKREYLRSTNIISKFGYDPYIVEACQKGGTFLEGCSSKVFYSNVNNPHLRNKGVNEARSLLESFKYYSFNDNDTIVKLTGRYFFENDSFLRLVEQNPDIDAFVKLYTNLRGRLWASSGCFAMKGKYFKDMLCSLNLSRMESNAIAIEEELLDYIQKLEAAGAKIMYVSDLNVASHVYCSGNHYNPNKLTHW